ncbi:MAG: hypothetical protein J0I77_17025 [Rudaea sp.]|uniref:hypothetical protein n=1 Tax=unclassified Rudaea TaxID=2627037 RepID=UPI0010F55FE9|nr:MULTISPECIES: hypothetical protein [unclassified Rudaea]MBN8887429.1 hypothetical protein [Rudaea sp.]MBR0346665.1 hypothetical protein [Rudaea sp.]
MSTRDREEVHWRELRKRLVEAWNRDGIDDADADDGSDLQMRVRIPHYRDENGERAVHHHGGSGDRLCSPSP